MWQIYIIIIAKIPKIKPDLVLQMFFHVINDLTGLNGLVLTSMIFSSYSRMIKPDAQSSSITQHTLGMQKVINKVKKSTASQQINNKLKSWNRFFIIFVYDLLINLHILVYWEENAGQSRK